jgi:hypothetical protein
MMNWIQERSKNNYDDDEGVPSSEKWYHFPLILLFMALLPYLFVIFAILFTLGITFFGFYFNTKHTVDSGDLKFPFLAWAGVGVAFVLTTLFANNQINLAEHAAIIGFSLIFIFVFTLAPLIGLTLRFFRQNNPFPKNDNNHGV